jgi:hypothetical protein
MARITVTADETAHTDAPVLLDESVYAVHLSTEHAARQLLERLLWALADAERAEAAHFKQDPSERAASARPAAWGGRRATAAA